MLGQLGRAKRAHRRVRNWFKGVHTPYQRRMVKRFAARLGRLESKAHVAEQCKPSDP